MRCRGEFPNISVSWPKIGTSAENLSIPPPSGYGHPPRNGQRLKKNARAQPPQVVPEVVNGTLTLDATAGFLLWKPRAAPYNVVDSELKELLDRRGIEKQLPGDALEREQSLHQAATDRVPGCNGGAAA
jgi:hypothetical protein